MRSDRDKRTDTEREIDDFLSKFENPADELSADIDSYLDEQNDPGSAPVQTFSWKVVDFPDLNEPKNENNATDTSVNQSNVIVNDTAASDTPSAENDAEQPKTEDKASRKKKRKRSRNRKKKEMAPAVAASAEPVIEEPAPVEPVSPEEVPEEPVSDGETSVEPAAVSEEVPEEPVYSEDIPEEPAATGEVAEESVPDEDAGEEKSEAAEDDKPVKKEKSSKKGGLGRALFLKENKDYDPSKGATYVKDGKTIKNKEYKFSFLKLIRDFAVVGVLCCLAGLIAVIVIVSGAPKYDYTDIYSQIDTASIVYNDQGKQIDNIYYTENRKIVKYEDMPEDLINAFVAIEDKTFWKHHGFNWTRMIGAVLSSLTGSGRISGTSTITQQLARNVYLADIKSVRSIKRKLLEMYYASRLEHFLTKEQIIEAYLNTIYLGHGCYGVNAAARTYFSKSVKDLDLVECASLAALPQSPDTYALLKLASEAQDVVDSEVVATEPDTVVTNDISRERRKLTLDLMLSQGLISKDEYDKSYDLTLNDFINPNLKSNSSIYSYFHEYLVDTIIADLMEQYDMDYDAAERMVYTKGLQIYSTVDSTAMKIIAKEFQDGSNFPYVSAPRDGEGNLLNNDGKIALYNYENFFDGDGNFRLSGADGDVTVHDDGSITINADHKLHIYETDVNGETDYSLEFKSYYIYDENDILYSISGGYLNIPAAYKSADGSGNVVIDKAYFDDEYYKGAIEVKGKDVILTPKSYTLSPRQRQPQAAMTIVGVGTGEVKAMVGGRQFGGQKMLNRSLNPRQPGSSIKPLAVYGAALQKSYELAEAGEKWKFTNFHMDRQGTKGWGDYVTVHSSIEDERTKIEGKYWPNNFNNSFSGKNTFKTAIQKSINTCAVKLVLQVGSEFSIEQLKKFGLTTVQDDLSNPVNDANPAALGLGAMTQGVEPLEMALAYASFPGGGKVNTPICYTKVLDRNGKVLLKGKSEQSEALNEGVAWIMQEVLKSVVSYNNYMYVTDVEPGGKTGTTNDQYDIWFDGFTPTYAASIWIGTDENLEMSSMSTPAAALWGKIINQIPTAKNGSYPKQPDNVIQIGGEYFTKGTETGLTSWSHKEEQKKRREAAYKKWLRERENHKKKVIDVKGHYEYIKHPAETHKEDDLDNPIYGTKLVDDEEKPIIDEESGEIIGYEQKEVTDYDNIIGYKQKTVVDKEAWKEKVWIEEKWHYEYEKGWRDGDFKYRG